jgi:hypothetical protein
MVQITFTAQARRLTGSLHPRQRRHAVPRDAKPQASLPPGYTVLVCLGAVLLLLGAAEAQLTDLTQTPNRERAGMHKSLAEQIGPGRGDVHLPDSSLFLIQRDPFRTIRRGRQLFQRKFTVAQGFGPRLNDGEGNIEQTPAVGHGLMDSCAGCHAKPRGAAGAGGAVIFTRPDHRKAPHLFGVELKEMLADEITAELRDIQASVITLAQQRQQDAILRFLESLIVFPPDDTASNLAPGDQTAADFPQRGHGSLQLGVLFNDPRDPE